MNKWRQGIIALLERSPDSEWISANDICNVLLGRPYQDGDFFMGSERDKDGNRIFGPRSEILQELRDLAREGKVERRAHAGWRIK